MFVSSPPVTSNGNAVRRHPLVRWGDSPNFSTLALARAYVPIGGVVNTSTESYRERNLLGKGIVAYKKYKPTSYYSFAMKFQPSGFVRQVYSYNPGGGGALQYRARYRELGYSYVGGGGTGMGSLDLLFRRSSKSNDWRAVANRALIANLEARARSEIMIKARRNKMSLGESLAELPKTISLVAWSTTRLYFAFQHLRRGDVKKASEALGIRHLTDRRGRVVERASSLESKWLALRYGWLPIAYDIYDGVKAVQAGFDNPTHFTVSRNVKEVLPLFGHMWNLNDAPWRKIKYDFHTQCDVQYKYRLRVKDATLSYLTSFGLENPLYVAWQLVPYSFVLDWALPISDWLSALSAPLGLDFLDGYRSTHVEHTSNWTIGGFGGSGSSPGVTYIDDMGEAKAVLQAVELSREKLTSFPIVSPYARIPGLSPTRIADAIALTKEYRRTR